MFGTFGFSYIGLIFLCCLSIPNILWAAFFRSTDGALQREYRGLLVLERVGQVGTTVCLLIFVDYTPRGFNLHLFWLLLAALLMIIYLLCWVRYFRGPHIAYDFYRPFWCIPLPLATLPVAAALCLAIYGRVGALAICVIMLGIGHIGIHAQHWLAIKKRNAASTTKT